jgi:D-sedoheptulose 7-phosphate isomerase
VSNDASRSLHLTSLFQRAPALQECESQLLSAFNMLRDCFRSGGKVLLCGNGGSASDAEHWAGELLKGFLSKRPLDAALQEKFGAELASHLQGSLPAIPLTGFPALRSAFANDCDDNYSYAQLVFGLAKPGDIVIGISTSGNAANVWHALAAAQGLGVATLALTGGNGGRLAALADLSIIAPANEVYLIQELHLPIYHCLSLMLEDEFFLKRARVRC